MNTRLISEIEGDMKTWTILEAIEHRELILAMIENIKGCTDVNISRLRYALESVRTSSATQTNYCDVKHMSAGRANCSRSSYHMYKQYLS